MYEAMTTIRDITDRIAALEARVDALESSRTSRPFSTADAEALSLTYPPVRVDRTQLAEVLGVHPDTISDFTAHGMPVLELGGRGVKAAYDLVACIVWWRRRRPSRVGEAGALPVDRVQLAAILGVHPDTISDFARDGMPVLEPGGRGAPGTYDAVACSIWWRANKAGSSPRPQNG